MFATTIKFMAKKRKSPMILTPPEPAQTVTRAIFDIVKEHGPITVSVTWERVQGGGVQGLTSETQMKNVSRWMRQRQKLKQICNDVCPNKQLCPQVGVISLA